MCYNWSEGWIQQLTRVSKVRGVNRNRRSRSQDPRLFVCEAALTSAGNRGRRCERHVSSPGEKCSLHQRQSAFSGPPTQLESDLVSLLKKVGASGEARRDPREVLLDTVTRAHQMVAVLDAMVRSFEDGDLELLGREGEMEVVSVGRVAAAVPTDRALRASHVKAVLELHGKWTKEAATISQMTIRAGVEDRLVRLAEQQSRLIADVIRGAVESLPLDSEVRRQLFVEIALRLRKAGAQEPVLVGPGQEVHVA